VNPNQVQKWITIEKGPGAINRISVSQRLGLLDEVEIAQLYASGRLIGVRVTWLDDHANFFNASSHRLFDN
jgi:hypothetical protein